MNDRLHDEYRRDSRERADRDDRREEGADRSDANDDEPRYNEPPGGGEWNQQGSSSRGGREDCGDGPYEYSGIQRRDDDRGYARERGRDRYFGSRRRGFGRDYGYRYPLGSLDEEARADSGPGNEGHSGDRGASDESKRRS